MSDIINLLPDSVANQIAAGEVIQRPASVVKELMENSIDAGAKFIQVVIKDGGTTLIQVIDDGVGMSETDARMCFERHATSKIKNPEDLFMLQTKGFRGEALPSVASVAQVELRTRKADDSLGTFIEVAGSRVFKQERQQISQGTNIQVKNLFFNVPARRRFLKAASTEMSHIRNEFLRIVLVHPAIRFALYDGDIELFNLPETSLKGRVDHVFGATSSRLKMDQQLLPIDINTDIVKISGFVGRPEFARKRANQYFFVNNRYMRHPYFHKAVMLAYERMLKQEEYPNYFIYLEVDTNEIDVNVHPSKTEIKFENEQVIFSILQAAVKETLGKFQVMPAIDFDTEGAPDIPHISSKQIVMPPEVSFNADYNPFKSTSSASSVAPKPKQSDYNWEKLYQNFSSHSTEKNQIEAMRDESKEETKTLAFDEESVVLFQVKNRYIISETERGLMFIDQYRAHFRILFDRYMIVIQNQQGVSQKVLFPETLNLNEMEDAIFEEILPELRWAGFDIEKTDRNNYIINGVPTDLSPSMGLVVLRELIDEMDNEVLRVKVLLQEKIAIVIARKFAIQRGKRLTNEEMSSLYRDLFACENHQHSPDGKRIIYQLSNEELGQRFD